MIGRTLSRLAILVLAISGCYKPSVESCQYACAASGEPCPSGLTCVANMCVAGGDTCGDGGIVGSGSGSGTDADSACATGWCPDDSGVATDLHAVWALNDGEMWAVGSKSTILHYTNNAWQLVASPFQASTELDAVTGDGLGNVFIGGANGTIVRWGGTQFDAPISGVTGDVTGLAIANHVVVAVAGKNSYRFDPGLGAGWAALTEATNDTFERVGFGWGSKFVATTSGKVQLIDTTALTWTPEPGSTSGQLGVYATNNDMFTVFGSTIIHGLRATDSFSTEFSGGDTFTAIDGTLATDVFAVGASVAHRGLSTWQLDTSVPAHPDLEAVAATVHAVVAVGKGGTILRLRR